MKNSRILLIGCGSISQNMHLPAILNFFKKDDISILDNDLKTLKAVQISFDIPVSYSDIVEVDFNNYKYVVIAVPYQYNYDILTKLLPFDLKIMCEKPVVSNYNDYKILEDKIKFSKSEIFINQTRRFSPIAKEIKKLLIWKQIIKVWAP
jgi:virulence factor